MWELDGEESWVPKNWCFWTVVLEMTLESLQEDPMNPSYRVDWKDWVFIGRTDVEAETPILWPPDMKSWLIGKDPNARNDWGWKEEGMTEDEMAGWHHRLNGHEFEWTPGFGDGQGGLACCNSWGRKELDMTELPNWTELKYTVTIMGHCMSYFATNKMSVDSISRIGVFKKRSNRIRYVFYLVRQEGKVSKSIFKASGSSSHAIVRTAGRWHSGFLILSSNKLQLLKC